MKNRSNTTIYFDNAATTPLISEVKEAMVEIMETLPGNPSSIHAFGRSAKTKVEQARKVVALGLNASIGEIFFTSSATESNNAVLRKSVEDLGVKRIITSAIEHPCVLETCRDLEKQGVIKLEFLPVNNEGGIDLKVLEDILPSPEKTLVSLMYGNNEIGTMNPLKEIALLCKQYNALIHSDAVQVLGKYKIDVQELGLDFLTGTAHKFFGPKGSAFMYINGNNTINAFLTGGAQERNMRAGTENVIGIVGLATAFQSALDNMEDRKSHISSLRNYMKDQLSDSFEDIEFNGSQTEPFLYHILSVSFPASAKNDMLIYNLDIHKICASAGSACSSGTNTGSHVLGAIHPDSLRNTIRFSFSHLNTMKEIDYTISVLKELIT